MGLKLFNKLDISVRGMSKSVFSDKLGPYSWLVLNPFYKIDKFSQYSCRSILTWLIAFMTMSIASYDAK